MYTLKIDAKRIHHDITLSIQSSDYGDNDDYDGSTYISNNTNKEHMLASLFTASFSNIPKRVCVYVWFNSSTLCVYFCFEYSATNLNFSVGNSFVYSFVITAFLH